MQLFSLERENGMLHSICIPIAYLDKNTSYKMQDFITDTTAGIFSRMGGNTLFYTIFFFSQSELV